MDEHLDSGGSTRRCLADIGQAAVAGVVVAAVLFAAVLVGVSALGRLSLERTRAQTAADAAALASLSGGRADAVRVAIANGATLMTWVVGPGPDEVAVTVRVGASTATARATDAP